MTNGAGVSAADAFSVSLDSLRQASTRLDDDATLVLSAVAGLTQVLRGAAPIAGEGPLAGALQRLADEVERRGRGLGENVSRAGDALADGAVVYSRAEDAVSRAATGLMS